MFDTEMLKSLAKIDLTEAEKAEASEYFGFWTEKLNKLENINTENIEPLATVSSLENVMREDASFKMTDRETLLNCAPDQYDGYFVVPRILD